MYYDSSDRCLRSIKAYFLNMQLGEREASQSLYIGCWLVFAVVSIVVFGGNHVPSVYLRSDTTIEGQ